MGYVVDTHSSIFIPAAVSDRRFSLFDQNFRQGAFKSHLQDFRAMPCEIGRRQTS